MLNLEEIKKILPHRYPFLLVDRVLEIHAGEYCQALKNISGNEAVFQGHFPQQAVFPGVMIIEALAQTAGIVIDSGKDETEWGTFYRRAPPAPGSHHRAVSYFGKPQ